MKSQTEVFTLQINSEIHRAYQAALFTATKIERASNRVDRIPPEEIRSGTHYIFPGQDSTIYSHQFILIDQPNVIAIDIHTPGRGVRMSYEFAEHDGGTFARVTIEIRQSKFAHFIERTISKWKKAANPLQEIKELAESNQDLRV